MPFDQEYKLLLRQTCKEIESKINEETEGQVLTTAIEEAENEITARHK